MNIHIYYRHTTNNNINQFRPEWFNYEHCFVNFLNTIKRRDNIKLTLALDGDIENDFTKNYKDSFELFQINNNSSLISWRELLEYIKDKNIPDDDIIYFVENDYLHIKTWVDEITSLYSTYSNLTYISLYDHNDKYIDLRYSLLSSKIICTDTIHWRTTPSTCGTFMINGKTFKEDYDIWSIAVGDHNTFLELTEKRNRFVLTPIPGLATHCMEGLLSPTIEWGKI